MLSALVFIFFWLRVRPVEINYDAYTDDIQEVSEPTVTFVNPAKGAEEPTVTIIEYGDFECGPCKTLSSTLQTILSSYPDDVQVVWKDLPNESLHELSTPAAIAAHCADRQGTFWGYHDELFVRQSYLSESQFLQIATTLGLDVEKFQSCYDDRETLPIVKKDYEEALGLGLTSTPTLFIGDEILVGAVSSEQLIEMIEDLLANTP